MRARDYLNKNEMVIVLCTKGDQLRLNLDGTGSSGNWKISSRRSFQQVILYLCTESRSVITARVMDIQPSEEPGRFVIRFYDARKLGETSLNWLEFAEGSRNPIRYLP